MRSRSQSVVLAVLSSVLVFDAIAQQGVPFQPVCTLPFAQIAEQQEIDLDCRPAAAPIFNAGAIATPNQGGEHA